MSTSDTTNAAHVKSKKPSDSAFKQQRLPAWQPILTAGTVLPTFFIVGITFIPIGIALLYLSEGVGEKSVDFTYCTSKEDPLKNCSDIIKSNTNDYCSCDVTFSLDTPLEGIVYMYYGLSNFYQNHRRYVKSRDDYQLLGHLSTTPSSDCEPYQFSDNKKPIAPCGAIANSLFSDDLTISSTDLNKEVPLLRTGIAWPSDKESKFRNPPQAPGQELKDVFKGFDKPKMWKKNIWELDLKDPNNNGFQNEDLIVWMRTAALPDFRKLYRRVDHTVADFSKGMPRGNYTLHVVYNYPVAGFGGSKQMILSTTSLLGGKNSFLGYAYIVVGCICLVLGVAFLIIHIKFGKSTTEVINVNPHASYQ